jgi:hypothetical protein
MVITMLNIFTVMIKYKNFFCKECQIMINVQEHKVSFTTYSAASFAAK